MREGASHAYQFTHTVKGATSAWAARVAQPEKPILHIYTLAFFFKHGTWNHPANKRFQQRLKDETPRRREARQRHLFERQ
jgi:hypothetical protein